MATRRVTAALALLTALSNWADGVPKAPFKPDAHTTLLAHFDGTVRADLAKGERAAVFRNGFGGKTLPPGQVHLAPHEGFGQAVHLRASEQIVYKVEDGNFPFDPADIYAAGTIEFLIKTSWAGDDGALHTVFIADDGKNRNYVRLDKMKGNTLDASVASTKPGGKKRWSSVRRAVTAKTWPNDTWRHVAVCWGNGVLTLWVDGEIWDRATGVSSPVGLPAAGIVLQGNGALIDELRVSNIIRYGSHTMQASNLIHHSSFEGETAGQPPRQTWHRVGSYLPEETPWRVKASDAFHGEQCVRTDKPGKLTFQREIHERGQGEYVLSVYLKAAKSSHKAKLSLTTYRKWDPFRTDTFEKSVEVGLEWTRHVFPIDIPSADCRPILGAVDIGIESLEPGALLADAVQFEMGPQATPYGEPDMLLSKQRAEGLHFPLYPIVEEPTAPTEHPAATACVFRLTPLGGGERTQRGRPMQGTVPLPQGIGFEKNTWRLKNKAGTILPSQLRVLARWRQDGSIKALEVVGESDGSGEWFLECNADSAKPSEVELLWQTDGSSSVSTPFFVTSLDDREFTSGPGETALQSIDKPDEFASVRVEENGPMRSVLRLERPHTHGKEQLLTCVARVHTYRNKQFRRLEYTWVNTNASPSVAVRSIGCRIPLDWQKIKQVTFFGSEGRRHLLFPTQSGSILQCDTKVKTVSGGGKYFYAFRSGDNHLEHFTGKAEGRVRVELQNSIVEVTVKDWWQNHPMEIACDKQGLTVYFWSPRVKAVELTQAMAKSYTVDIWRGPMERAPGGMGGPIVLVASPEAYCRSGVFGGTFLATANSPFPIFERTVIENACLSTMAPSYLNDYDCYGQFNQGDFRGDGGWSNLETQRGHAAWLYFMRSGDPALFHVAEAAARHYRDSDIDQFSGAAIIHNVSHTLGTRSTSHAWVQGMLDHCLVTGDRRTMEVALLHAGQLKHTLKSPEKRGLGGRIVTRILDNLADLFMVTSDDALPNAYGTILNELRELVQREKATMPGIFQDKMYGPWYYRADFMPWYGLYSLAKMRLATGDPRWQEAFIAEANHALSRDTFAHSSAEFFVRNELSDDERIVRCLAEGSIGDRGCMLFPVLGYLHQWTGDRRWLEIGMTTVYIAIISGEYRDPLYVLASTFLEQARQAGLTAADEQRYFDKAVAIMKGAARSTLTNGGFEGGKIDWKGHPWASSACPFWAPKRDICFKIDPNEKKEGRQSLHMIVRQDMPPWGIDTRTASEYFRVRKGQAYTVSGWLKIKGDVNAVVYQYLFPLAVGVESSWNRTSIAGRTETTREHDAGRPVVSPPDADGWQRWQLSFVPEADSLARLKLYVRRNTPTSEGDGWWDGIALEDGK